MIAAPSRSGLPSGAASTGRIADATRLSFEPVFDAVFSNAALHWVTEPTPAIAGVWNALKPGGRFVAELGGAGNVSSIRHAFTQVLGHRGVDAQALDPWYLPTPRAYGSLLEAQGFRVDVNIVFPRPMPLPSDIRCWLEIFAQPFLAGVPESDRPSLIEEVRTLLQPDLLSEAGVWIVDYVRLRVAARKPA